MSELQLRLGNYYYGPNKNLRVFNKYRDLTTTFKQRFKSGSVKQLPPGWTYNAKTDRFAIETPALKRKIIKDELQKVNGVLIPSDLSKTKREIFNQRYMNSFINPIRQRISALQGVIARRTYTVHYTPNISANPYFALKYLLSNSAQNIKDQLDFSRTTQKISINVDAEFKHIVRRGELRHFNIKSEPQIFSTSTSLQQIKNTIDTTFFNYIKSKIKKIENEHNYLFFVRIIKVYIDFLEYNPTRGSSYIELPKFLQTKKALINIKNEDNKCFMYSVLCGLHYDEIKDNHNRVSKYHKRYRNELSFKGIEFPVKADHSTIKKFENQNNIGINIFTVNNKSINSHIITKKQNCKIINLLLITGEQNNHYVYIKDLSRLVGSQYNNKKCKKHICYYCLHAYTTENCLKKHLDNGCAVFGEMKTKMPTPGKDDILQFKNTLNERKAPFVIYGDFEALPQPIVGCENNNSKSYTEGVHNHVPSGFKLFVKSSYENINFKPIIYRGEDTITRFYEELTKLENKITYLLQRYKGDMRITKQHKERLKNATHCHICKNEFKTGEKKVLDHDHINGLYRGIAHNKCNLNYNWKNFKIPVFFHNMKGYDSHFIISEMNSKNAGTKVKVLATSEEKFITFSFRRVKFIDSFAFLSSGLDKLVKNLKQSGDDNFKNLRRFFPDEEKFQLLTRKGVYPYEYMTDFSKFNETQLPPIEAFYSSLNDETITQKDYNHAVNVWDTFNIQNLGEYHDLYLTTDVLLLADVFEAFRNLSIQSYGLDPAHYISLPSFAWDCMLKKTDVKLQLLTDNDMYLFFERSKRGGVSMITHRHAKANNKLIGDEYDDTKPKSYITYLDANNLYGWAMSQFLPCGEFKWVDDIENFNLQTMNSNENIGYLLEVDLEYPEELHDLHNDLPVAPENIIVSEDMMSKWLTDTKAKLNDKKISKVKKLIPNLMKKKNYVLHSANLEYYISLGLKVSKIHRVLQFKQSKWLEGYIALNTDMRAKAKNDFEKDFYKLMNNAVFGKTMENVRERLDYELVNNKKRFLKVSADPKLQNATIIRPENGNDHGLVGMARRQTEVKLYKPIYAGCAILELSKIWMYKFHYGFIKEKYSDKAQLLFTDTDSLCYHIQTEDLHKDFKENEDLFDFSGMTKDNMLYSEKNKKVIGKFKPEEENHIIKEFCGLRAKCYSLTMTDNIHKHTGKGIKRSALMKIQHDDYLRCLFGDTKDKVQMVQFNSIRSYKHKVQTIRINKIGLASSDDKRYILEDGITSYSYGHKNIIN